MQFFTKVKSVFLTVLPVLIFALIFVLAGQSDSGTAQVNKGQAGTKAKGSAKKAMIIVQNQVLRGNAVTVSRVVLDRPGFVVVHTPEAVQGGAVCQPIGVSALVEGEHSNVNTIVGGGFVSGNLNIMLHYDNGDGIFDPTVDLPVKQASGKNLAKTIKITAGAKAKAKKAALTASSQTLKDGRITILKAVFEEGKKGFVVVHRPEAVSGGTVCAPLATSPLLEGEQSNVAISVGGGFRSGNLNIMLHYDNGDGIFDPATDLPAQSAGRNLSRTIRINAPR